MAHEKVNFVFSPEADAVCSAIASQGYEICAVGGCVRDFFMKRTAHDIDLTTNAPSEKIIEILQSAGIYAYDKGGNCGTVGARLDGAELEITPYRSEGGYYDHRHPTKVVFEESIDADLSRRDFTVNAMAISYDGALYDLFGGRKDIESRILRCVGNPVERFSEDALRILRALRFSSKLGFTIEEETEKALYSCEHLLSFVSGERIREELCGILMGEHPSETVCSYKDILSRLLCDITPCELERLPASFEKRLFYLVKDASLEDILRMTERIKLSGAEKNIVVKYKEMYDVIDLCSYDEKSEDFARLVLKYGSMTEDFLSLFGKGFNRDGRPVSVKELDISGDDIVSLGFCGKDVGRVLERLFVAVFTRRVQNSKESLKKEAKTVTERK